MEDGVGAAGARRRLVAEVAAVAEVIVDLVERNFLTGFEAAKVPSRVGSVKMAFVGSHSDNRIQRRFPT